MGRLAEYRKLQEKHLARVEMYLARLKALYSKAVSGLVDLASEAEFDGEGQFYFSDYPELKKEVNEVVSNLATGIEQTVLRGTTAEWAQGNTNADGTVEYVLDKAGIESVDDLTDKAVGRYFNNHDSALKAFQKRKIGNGQTLSTKVWDLANHQKVEVELARSIAEGVSAAKIASSMKSLLKEPNKLFRRVRDKNGVLRLSKNAKAYHPGAGTYRSSYRNALRLARTETNMAYRSAEWEGYQDKPYVVGFEIKRSTHPYDCPVCEALAGKYPKDFKWSGWHPNCRCHMIPITFTEEEMDRYGDAFVEGEDFDSTTSVNYVGDVPNGFREWIEVNHRRVAQYKTLPYFIRDNEGYVDNILASSDVKASLVKLRSDGYFVNVWDGTDKTVEKVELSSVEKEFRSTPFSDIDFNALKEEVSNAFGEIGVDLERSNITWLVKERTFSIEFSAMGGHVDVDRLFGFDDNGLFVDHELFTLPSELQGKGASKKILGAFFKQYERIGVKTIKVFANLDVGGYTWARYGFSAELADVQRILDNANNLPQGSIKEARAIVDKFYATSPDTSRFPMRLLTGYDWSKVLLLGKDWDGEMNLTDKQSVAYFKDYLYRKK